MQRWSPLQRIDGRGGLALARALTKMARTPACIRADLVVIGVLRYSATVLSALVRDGGIVGGRHYCNNYWLENGTADRIATKRLRHSGSFAACSPRGL